MPGIALVANRKVYLVSEATIMKWPNSSTWRALASNESIVVDDRKFGFQTIDCGEIFLPSGRLVACDPFVFLEKENNVFVQVPQGRFPVFVTLADVSEEQDGSHVREAYASIIFSNEPEVTRKMLVAAKAGAEKISISESEIVGFPVDAGTGCFVDDEAVATCMPDERVWLEEVFDSDGDNEDDWFHRMDNPNEIRHGIANIVLPHAQNGENIVLFHSGWGDGVYPIVGGYDAQENLVCVHIDFMIVPEEQK